MYFQITIWSQGRGLVTKKELATEKYSQTGRVGVDATDLLVFTKVLLTVGIQGLGWSWTQTWRLSPSWGRKTCRTRWYTNHLHRTYQDLPIITDIQESLHSSIAHKSQDIAITKISVCGWTDKEIAVYTDKGILFGFEKKRSCHF